MIRSLLALMITFSGLIVTQTQPAHAFGTSCASNRLCTYIHIAGGGSQYDYTYTWQGNCVNIGGAFHDAISSLWNNTGHIVYFYQHAGCQTPGYAYPVGYKANVFWPDNDTYSSFSWGA